MMVFRCEMVRNSTPKFFSDRAFRGFQMNQKISSHAVAVQCALHFHLACLSLYNCMPLGQRIHRSLSRSTDKPIQSFLSNKLLSDLSCKTSVCTHLLPSTYQISCLPTQGSDTKMSALVIVHEHSNFTLHHILMTCSIDLACSSPFTGF